MTPVCIGAMSPEGLDPPHHLRIPLASGDAATGHDDNDNGKQFDLKRIQICSHMRDEPTTNPLRHTNPAKQPNLPVLHLLCPTQLGESSGDTK